MNLYRYVTCNFGSSVKVVLCEYVVIRETPCGYWFVASYDESLPDYLKEKYKRWTSKTAYRRYAYPCKEAAFNSWRIRAQRRLQHLERQMAVASAAVKIQKPDDSEQIAEEYFELFDIVID